MFASTITCSRHTPGPTMAPRSRPRRGPARHIPVALPLPRPDTLTPAQQSIGQHPRSTQLVHRQPFRHRGLPTIRPRLRQRHRPAHITRADKHQPTTPAFDIQNLQTPASKHVKRMGHR